MENTILSNEKSLSSWCWWRYGRNREGGPQMRTKRPAVYPLGLLVRSLRRPLSLRPLLPFPHGGRAQLQAASSLSHSGSHTSYSRRQCICPCFILPAAAAAAAADDIPHRRLNASILDKSIAGCTQNTRGRCSASMGFVYEISCCGWRVVGYLDELWLHGRCYWHDGCWVSCVSLDIHLILHFLKR